MFQFSFFLFGILTALANANGIFSVNSISLRESVVYFPNPNGDGSLMPAVLTPTAESWEKISQAQAQASSVRFLLYTK